MGYDVVFTKEAFAKKLIHIATDVESVYNNKFPNNCGYYHDNGKFSWDCWNLVKSLIWGWQEDRTVGYYCYQPNLYGLGDWDGGTIMSCCDDVSSDFSEIEVGEFLLTAAKDHAAVYVGEFTDRSGQPCNVVECTTSWNERRVIGSWVDPDGTRRNCKNGLISKSWDKHGKLPWVDYGTQPKPPTPPEPKRIAEDGWWGKETTFALQELLGCHSMDGIVSRQPQSNRKYLANASVSSWEFKGFPWYVGGSAVIKALQQRIDAQVDGYFGRDSVGCLQEYLKARGYYNGLIDHSMGAKTVEGLQMWINANF